MRCEFSWNPGVWPYTKRCQNRETELVSFPGGQREYRCAEHHPDNKESLEVKEVTIPHDKALHVRRFEIAGNIIQIGGTGDGYCYAHNSRVCKFTLDQARALLQASK